MKYNKREPTVWADYPDSGLFLYQSMQYKLPAAMHPENLPVAMHPENLPVAMHPENLPVADSVGGRFGWCSQQFTVALARAIC